MKKKWTHRLGVAALTLAAASQSATAQQQTDPTPRPVEYSLLTPGIAGKYVVLTINDLMTWIALGGHTNSVRQASLRELVQQEGYDASSSLAIAMKEELDAAGYLTEVEPIPRARPGLPQNLTRSDLPASPDGQFLLDVVIELIGLANASNGAEWEPAFQLRWRVMRPSGEIVVPTHTFSHGPFVDKDGNKYSRTTCGLPSFPETMKRPQALWDCFDLGLRESSRALIPLIRQKQDLALNGGSRSVAGTARTGTESTAKCNKRRGSRAALDRECGGD